MNPVLATIGRRVLPPVALLIGAIVLVQIVVTAAEVPPFVLASPLAIWLEFSEGLPQIIAASLVTGGNALWGLLVGAALGAVTAVLASFLRALDEALAPVVAAVAVVPIVALAPVLYTMFGSTSEVTRVAIAALAVFVPVFLNTLRGLRQVKPVQRELMRVYAASRWQQAATVTIPTALPYFFTGLRVASSLAVISALVAEYFGGPRTGLGSAITTAAASSAYARAWAFVLGSIVVGLVFFLAGSVIERAAARHR